MSAGVQVPQQFESEVTRHLRVQYLLFLPLQYPARPRKRWPLILFLHGAGERGTDLSKVSIHGPPKLVQNQPDFPFVVVSPQCPNGQHWSNDLLLALLDDVVQRYRIDQHRLYLTGLSMGGYGAWRLALARPERFAALAPLCGGGEVLPIFLASVERRRALRTLGIWAFHGAKDPVVPLSESERMVEALRKVGAQPKLTVYPESGHDCWTETYENPALYQWFLEHRREKLTGQPRSKHEHRSTGG